MSQQFGEVQSCFPKNVQASDFFDTAKVQQIPTILAVLLGGSRLYGDPSKTQFSDWDGAILVPNKSSMLDLVSTQRRLLMSMLHIVEEENPNLPICAVTSHAYNEIDAIRFVGVDRNGISRSVQLLDLESIPKEGETLRKLSFKEKRIYVNHCSKTGKKRYHLQQSTQHIDYLVRHDQWVYTSETVDAETRAHTTFAVFGITADLLMTGTWIYDKQSYGLMIQARILRQYSKVAGRLPSLCSFARCTRFTTAYVAWFTSHLRTLGAKANDDTYDPNECFCSTQSTLFYGPTPGVGSVLNSELCSRPLTTHEGDHPSDCLAKKNRNYWSCLSHCGSFLSPSSPTQDFDPEKQCFCHLFGPNPHVWYHHGPESIDHDPAGDDFLEHFLSRELKEADEYLRAYQSFLKNGSTAVLQRIRLEQFQPPNISNPTSYTHNSSFIEDLSGQLIRLSDRLCPLQYVLGLKWKINSYEYPSLEQIAADIDADLANSLSQPSTPLRINDPCGTDHPEVYAAGAFQQNDSVADQVIYNSSGMAAIDVLVDDVARVLTAHILSNTYTIDRSQCAAPQTATRLNIEENTIHTDLPTRIMRHEEVDLRRIRYDIKSRYMFKPLRELVDFDKHIHTLASTLFRYMLHVPDVAKANVMKVENLAIAITLSQIKSWKELHECIEVVLGQT